jgi:hypothetical protein
MNEKEYVNQLKKKVSLVMEKRPWHHALRACFFLTFKMVIHNFAQ